MPLNEHDERLASASQSTGAQSTCSVSKSTQKAAVPNGSKGASKQSQGRKKRARKAKRKRCGYLPVTKSVAAAVQDGTPDSTVEVETLSLPTTAVTENAPRASTGTRPDTFTLHRLTHSLSYQIKK